MLPLNFYDNIRDLRALKFRETSLIRTLLWVQKSLRCNINEGFFWLEDWNWFSILSAKSFEKLPTNQLKRHWVVKNDIYLGDLTLAWLDTLSQLLELGADLTESDGGLQLPIPPLQVVQLCGEIHTHHAHLSLKAAQKSRRSSVLKQMKHAGKENFEVFVLLYSNLDLIKCTRIKIVIKKMLYN